jgi:hypothetical protein
MEHESNPKADPEIPELDPAELFPRSPLHLEECLDALQMHYRPEKHLPLMVNHCFRCHQPTLTAAYNHYRQQHLPSLSEPPISHIYSNAAFISLVELSPFLRGEATAYSEHLIPPVPPSLSSILDKLFHLYGFVPHLERFLLFFPGFLEKSSQAEATLFEEGKLESKVAYFLAFLGATQLGSAYMMARYHWQFLRTGGDSRWIT